MRFIPIFFFIAVLSACAPSTVNMIPNTSGNVPLAADEGLVIARIVNASTYSRSFNYLTLAPKQLNETKEEKLQRLSAVENITSLTSIFAAPVKAGEYSLSSVYSYHSNANYYYQQWMHAEPSFGTFEVRPGQVTNLGTLVYYHKPDGDKYHKMLVRTDDKSAVLQAAKKAEPRLMALSQANDMFGWKEDDLSVERNDSFLNIVQNPVVHNKRFSPRKDKWVFSSKLGVLLQHDKASGWQLDDADTLYDIVHYSENSSGDRLLSSGANEVFVKSSNMQVWQRVAVDVGDDSIVNVYVDASGRLFIAHTSDYLLHVSEVVPGKPRHELITYSNAYGWLAPDIYRDKEEERKRAYTEEQGKKSTQLAKRKRKKVDSLAMINHRYTSYVAVAGKLYTLDYKLAKADPIVTPIKVGTLSQNGWNQLVVSSNASAWNGKITSAYSLNQGQTWGLFTNTVDVCPDEVVAPKVAGKSIACLDRSKRYKTYHHVGIPVFFEDKLAYSIMSKTAVNFWTSKRTVTYHLAKSSDAGQMWVKTDKDVPKYCSNLIKGVSADEILLSCQYSTGQFYRAHRDTLTWELIHEPALF